VSIKDLTNSKRHSLGSTQSIVNVLTVLTKHNLLRTSYNEFKHTLYYFFDHTECLLRLSFPRYIKMIASSTEAADDQKLVTLIIREIYLAGSLTKKEILQVLALPRIKSTLGELDATTARKVDKIIDDLTLGHYLVGVSQASN